MPSVENADANGDGDVEAHVIGFHREVFDGNMAQHEDTGSQLILRGAAGEGDRIRRTIDGKHMAPSDAVRNGARHRTGTAADLEHALARLERQGIDNRLQPWRQGCRHGVLRIQLSPTLT